jgi:hypothetical protein
MVRTHQAIQRSYYPYHLLDWMPVKWLLEAQLETLHHPGTLGQCCSAGRAVEKPRQSRPSCWDRNEGASGPVIELVPISIACKALFSASPGACTSYWLQVLQSTSPQKQHNTFVPGNILHASCRAIRGSSLLYAEIQDAILPADHTR